jgi:hypothetical protein
LSSKSDEFKVPTTEETSVETFRLDLEQAIILRICYNCGNRCSEKIDDWIILAKNIKLICDSYFVQVPMSWAGAVIIQNLLHFQAYLYSPNSLKYLLDQSQYQGDDELTDALLCFDITSEQLECMILAKAQEIFNSLSTCNDEQLIEAKTLLKMLPSTSSSPPLPLSNPDCSSYSSL